MFSTNSKIQSILPHPNVDIFRSPHHPYYIFSLEYMQESAGLRAYYNLCHILNELGYEAYVVLEQSNSGLRTPVLTNEIRKNHLKNGRHPIAVYGETTQGNPLEGAVVVRWILNNIGHIGANVTFSKDDLLFYWSLVYSNGEKAVRQLSFPLIDRQIFNKGNVADEERTGFCYYAHKFFLFDKNNATRQISEKIKANGISLCQDIKRTHIEIADILRHSKVLYCYEPSVITGEAGLCGCPSIIVKTEYLDQFDMDNRGFKRPIIPENEIDFSYIPTDNEDWIDYYNNREFEQWETIRDFIKITQDAADNCKNALKNATDDLIDFCNKHKTLYIYGAGRVARHCCSLMKILNIAVKGIVVSDDQVGRDSTPKNLCELPVFCLSDIKAKKEHCGLVLAMLIKNENEVIKTLNLCGFKHYTRYSLLLN